MKSAINRSVIGSFILISAVWKMSKAGVANRLRFGLLELIPQLLYYLAMSIIVLLMFSVIRDQTIPMRDLVIFLLVMYAVDSLGDALIFKGIGEYCASLRRGQTMYYLLSPGMPLFKVIFLRWDLPMLGLGAICGLGAILLSWMFYATNPILIAFALLFGTFTHVVLTSAFHIIQAYFDPTMPIALGSPSTRFYTKPMHLFVSGSVSLTFLMTFYPAYFMTAFPAGLAIQQTQGVLTQYATACYLVGALFLCLWIFMLNAVIKSSCRRRQN